MTRDELVEILKDIDLTDWSRRPLQLESLTVERTADRILSELEKEREGEEVLGVLDAGDVGWHMMAGPAVYKGKRGQLIFRPSKGEK